MEEHPVLASEAAESSEGRSGENNVLKGFRKRWESLEYRSPEHFSVGSSSGQDLPDFNSEQFLQELGDQVGDIGDWSVVGTSVDYVPSPPSEPAWEL